MSKRKWPYLRNYKRYVCLNSLFLGCARWVQIILPGCSLSYKKSNDCDWRMVLDYHLGKRTIQWNRALTVIAGISIATLASASHLSTLTCRMYIHWWTDTRFIMERAERLLCSCDEPKLVTTDANNKKFLIDLKLSQVTSSSSIELAFTRKKKKELVVRYHLTFINSLELD